jgi:hypothetical protein
MLTPVPLPFHSLLVKWHARSSKKAIRARNVSTTPLL